MAFEWVLENALGSDVSSTFLCSASESSPSPSHGSSGNSSRPMASNSSSVLVDVAAGDKFPGQGLTTLPLDRLRDRLAHGIRRNGPDRSLLLLVDGLIGRDTSVESCAPHNDPLPNSEALG